MEKIDNKEQIKKELDKLDISLYRDFNNLPYWEEKNEILESIKDNLKSKITEILVLELSDNVWPWSDKRKDLHTEIQRFIGFAEGRLKYYILKTNNEIAGVFIGSTWGSTLRTNDYYMQEFLKDPEINQKVKILKAKTSEFLK